MPIIPFRENPNYIDADRTVVHGPETFLAGDARKELSTITDSDLERAREREKEAEERGWKIGFTGPPPHGTRWLVKSTWTRHAAADCPALRRAHSVIFKGADGGHCPGRDCRTAACKRARRKRS